MQMQFSISSIIRVGTKIVRIFYIDIMIIIQQFLNIVSFYFFQGDEWVPESRILKINPENLDKKQKLLSEHYAGQSKSKKSKAPPSTPSSTKGGKYEIVYFKWIKDYLSLLHINHQSIRVILSGAP